MTSLGSGYLVLSDGSDTLNLACEEIEVDYKFEPEISHYEANPKSSTNSLGWHLGKEWLEFKAKGIYWESHSDFSQCIDYLQAWQNAGTFTLRVKRDGSNYTEWDGDNTTFTVLMKTGIKKMKAESITLFEDVWVLGMIDFEEAGARSS